jgi:UDP-N-acetylmuramate--alanine ligase
MNIGEIKTAYFLGIGGIGMSAIARYFKAIGMDVHGYDKTRNEFSKQLESEGFVIHYSENTEAIPANVISGEDSIVIYTPAIPKDHKEFKFFASKKIPIYKRAEVLGMISRNCYTIAVAGTHGKTTTSSMIAHMLNESGVNFTAFLGGISSNFESNYFHKEDGVSLFTQNIMVVEADEFDRSFLQLSPDIAIVTSTDADHLDIYGEAEEVKKSFVEFVHKLQYNGIAILNDQLDLDYEGNSIRYGMEADSAAKYSAIKIENHHFCFDYSFKNNSARVLNALPGFHNIENACAAITACLCLKLPLRPLIEAAANFKGVKRRFETVFSNEQYTVIDDYAHHPTELRACIKSVKELYPDKKLTGIFQPHLFSRTRDFADDFAHALDLLDTCWLLDIYPARELPIEGINSEFLALKMEKNPFLMAKESVLKNLQIEKPELLLIVGAGDIDQLLKPIKELYEKAN